MGSLPRCKLVTMRDGLDVGVMGAPKEARRAWESCPVPTAMWFVSMGSSHSSTNRGVCQLCQHRGGFGGDDPLALTKCRSRLIRKSINALFGRRQCTGVADERSQCGDALVVEFGVAEVVVKQLAPTRVTGSVGTCDQIGVLSFSQIIPGRLTGLLRIAVNTENVVPKLERLAQRQAISRIHFS